MKPPVGFGVCGTNTQMMSSAVLAWISSSFSAVMKPML